MTQYAFRQINKLKGDTFGIFRGRTTEKILQTTDIINMLGLFTSPAESGQHNWDWI